MMTWCQRLSDQLRVKTMKLEQLMPRPAAFVHTTSQKDPALWIPWRPAHLGMSLKMLERSASSPSRKRRRTRVKGVLGAQSPMGSWPSAHTAVRLSFGVPGTITCRRIEAEQ